MRLFDTHAHLDDESFDDSRAEVVARAESAGVEKMVCVGTTATASAKCVDVAAEFPNVYAAVGIQPNYCAEMVEGDWDRILELASAPKVVAIGETGLDRYWDHSPIELQRECFDRHLNLAREMQLPFIVHMRDCDDDIMQSLAEDYKNGPLNGIMHSFTGGLEMAMQCIQMGMHISFAGMVTFKKSVELRLVAVGIPEDRILIETDSPYLSPHPKRGQRPNEPALMIHTAKCIALERDVTAEEFGELTTNNANRIFGFDV